MTGLHRIEERLIALEEHFVVLSLSGLTILQILQVAFRYFLNRPLAFVDETSRYVFIWMVMVGAGLAMGKAAHFAIDAVRRALPRSLQIAGGIIVEITTIGFTLGVIGYGYALLRAVGSQQTAVLEIPFWIPYAAVPVSGALIILHVIFRIAGDLVSIYGKAADL